MTTIPSQTGPTPYTAGAAIGHAAAAGATNSGTAATQQFGTSDFMKLLVTEMKNQDPTQPTDPTQYVQQLVGVNSLQQLIQINEGINGTPTSQTAQQ